MKRGLPLIAAVAAAAFAGPTFSIRDLNGCTNTSAARPKDDAAESRQRKRYLQRQARKQQRRHK